MRLFEELLQRCESPGLALCTVSCVGPEHAAAQREVPEDWRGAFRAQNGAKVLVSGDFWSISRGGSGRRMHFQETRDLEFVLQVHMSGLKHLNGLLQEATSMREV